MNDLERLQRLLRLAILRGDRAAELVLLGRIEAIEKAQARGLRYLTPTAVAA